MRLFTKLLLVWMIAWLPVAGALAAVMPLAQQAAAMPCHDGGDAPEPGTACQHCVLCDLAGALSLPRVSAVAAVPGHGVFVAAPEVAHASFVPELAVPPPRPSLA